MIPQLSLNSIVRHEYLIRRDILPNSLLYKKLKIFHKKMSFNRNLRNGREYTWKYLDEQYYKLHDQIFILEKNLKKITKQRDTILPSFLDNGIVDWD